MAAKKFGPGVVLMAVIAGNALGLLAANVARQRADSSDVHTVNNFLNSSSASQELKNRFNAVINLWPPSRSSLGVILLDAQREHNERLRAAR